MFCLLIDRHETLCCNIITLPQKYTDVQESTHNVSVYALYEMMIIILMAEITLILRGWQLQMRETYMVYNFMLQHED